jgi:hypothetical protein
MVDVMMDRDVTEGIPGVAGTTDAPEVAPNGRTAVLIEDRQVGEIQNAGRDGVWYGVLNVISAEPLNLKLHRRCDTDEVLHLRRGLDSQQYRRYQTNIPIRGGTVALITL